MNLGKQPHHGLATCALRFRLATVLTVIAFSLLLNACGQVSFTADQHIERGLTFLEEGDVSAASIEFRNALQQDPSSGEGRYRLGMLLLDLGDVAGAEQELVRARDLGWDLDEVRLPLLRVHLMQARYGRVLEETSLIQSFPQAQVASALVLRGLAQLAIGNPEAAGQTLRSAIEMEPGLLDAQIAMAQWTLVSGGDRAEAQAWIERALEAHPAAPSAWELLGDLEQAAGRLEEAEAAFGQAVKHADGQVSPRAKRAFVRALLQDHDGATQDASALQRGGRSHPAASLVQGMVAMNQERFREAQAHFEAALAINSSYSPAMIYLGATHVTLGNREQAENYLLRYLNLHPDAAQVSRMLALLRMDEGDMARAERYLRPLLARSPDDVVALNILGEIHMARGEREAGLAQLQRVAALRPDDPAARANLGRELLRAGEQTDGLRELEAALELAPEARELEATLITNLIRAGEYARADEAITRFRQRDPTSAMGPSLRAALQLAQGETEQAILSLRDALHLNPGDPSATLILGNILVQQGETGEARRLYQASMDRHPDVLNVLLQAARLESTLGESAEMVRLLDKAIQAHPEAVAPRLVLAEHRLRSGEPEQAIALLQPLRGTSADDQPQFLDSLLRAQLAAGRNEDAVVTQRQLANIAPDTADARVRLAAGHLQTGRLDEAETQLNRALALDPGNIGALRLLAAMQFERGAFEEAASLARRLQEAQPEESWPFVLEGRSQMGLNRHDEAIRALQSAYQLDPNAGIAILTAQSYQLTGRVGDAVSLLTEHRNSHGETLELLGALGEAQINARAFDDALATLEPLARRSPDSADIQFALARAYAGQGRAEPMRAALDRALSLEPGHLNAGLTRIRLDLQQGELQQASQHHAQLLEVQPDQPDVLALGGEVALADGRPEDAVALYRRVLEQAQSPRWAMELARAQVQAGDLGGAAANLDDWLERWPDQIALQLLLAETRFMQGDEAGAKQGFARVLDTQADNVAALNNLAWLLREEDPETARRHAERAHALAPNVAAIKDTLGMVLLQHSGEAQRAVTLFREASAASPGDRTMRYHLALGLAQVGELDEARSTLDTILEDGVEFGDRAAARALRESLE